MQEPWIVSVLFSSQRDYSRARVLVAIFLELLPALAATAAFLLIAWWSPVERGRLPPTRPEGLGLFLLSISFVIAGIGWIHLRLAWVAIVLTGMRTVVVLVMLGALLDTYLYGCEDGPIRLEPCGVGDGWRLFQITMGMVVAFPVVSAVALGLFALSASRRH
jgi:hypothetical protein